MIGQHEMHQIKSADLYNMRILEGDVFQPENQNIFKAM
ncbi:hypothetical protein F652_1133 [Enterobacteriaceae bacterium bta3-1]|jgi:hypothetical protein|nr:hypothetical protein F652_1133 [Enterobacteriaceae bacterium bta3-1]